jgi:hypothetical protein
MVMLKQRGVDCVCRFTSHRNTDFRRGTRLGPGDHIVQWPKPTKPRTIDTDTCNALPGYLLVRELRLRVEEPGFRTTVLVIATTLLDAEENATKIRRRLWEAGSYSNASNSTGTY